MHCRGSSGGFPRKRRHASKRALSLHAFYIFQIAPPVSLQYLVATTAAKCIVLDSALITLKLLQWPYSPSLGWVLLSTLKRDDSL